jgi:uncharacterized protein with HEPN domain
MSKRSPELLVEDILEAVRKIKVFTKGMSFDKFINDEKTVDAVIRNFEIIGEASNRLPDEYRSKHNDVEWERMIGFRNRIIHDYFGIDHSIVWNIIQKYLPELSKSLGAIQKKKK